MVLNMLGHRRVLFFPIFSPHYGRTINGHSINSSQELATYFLDEVKLEPYPLGGFGADNHMRFATSEIEINRGLDRIQKALEG